MENSMNSMSKLSISHDHDDDHDLDDEEESGWTMYFEDFCANKMDGLDDINPSSNLSYGCDSLVSDAASSAAKKTGNEEKMVNRASLGKKVSFKKRRSSVLVDDALEDTASSPVNSPKVSYLNEVMTMNSTKEKRNPNISKSKGSGYGQVDGARKGIEFIGRDSDCSELKKRGLCLLPLSMLSNFLA